MGTFEGLSVPLYGSWIMGNESQTAILTCDTAAAWNWAYTSPGADNLLAVTVTDSNTVTSGYLQTFYANVTTSGSYSGGGTQINPIAVDLSLGGTIGCEAAGLYIYVAASGTPTVTSGNITGATIYMTDMGGSPGYQSCINLYKNTTNLGSTSDAFIFCVNQGSGNTTSLIACGGTNHPTYFLSLKSAANNMVAAVDSLTSAGCSQSLVVDLNGTTKYIPLITAS